MADASTSLLDINARVKDDERRMGAQPADEEPEKEELDLIEDTIGSVGRWQILMIFLISLIPVHISWHQLGILFLAPETNFYCSDNETEKCSPECTSYEYDKSEFTDTIIMEWDLVCDREYYINQVLQPAIMGGIFIGSLSFGYISDRFGRKYPMIVAAILEGITGVGAAYVPWLQAFIVLKFIGSIFLGGLLVISFILAMELIGKSHRTLIGVLFHFPYYLGYGSLGLIGYLIRDWHHFQLAISVTNFLFILYIWIIPESPRWLLLVGRRNESIAILENAAKFNNLSTYNIADKVLTHEKLIKDNTKRGSYLDLIRTYEMRKRTICVSVITFAVYMAYFGIAQYMGQIGRNIFINSSTGLLAIPGNTMCIFAMNKLGRKYTILLTNISCGICFLLIMAVPSDADWGVTVLGAIGFMFTGMSVAICYVYTGELYPTIIRSIGLGVGSMWGKVGSTVVSYVVELKKEQSWLPPTILGAITIVSVVFCFGLPETLNQKLPETIEEAENIGKSNKK